MKKTVKATFILLFCPLIANSKLSATKVNESERTIEYIKNHANLRGHKAHVAPIIKSLARVHLLFAEDLQKGFSEKSWWYVNSFQKSIPGIAVGKKEQVGFQDKLDIELLKQWHLNAPPKDAGGLITHELVISLLQKHLPETDPKLIQQWAEELNEVIQFDTTLNAAKLVRRMQKMGIDHYTLKNVDKRSSVPKKFDQCRLVTAPFILWPNERSFFSVSLEGKNLGHWHGVKNLAFRWNYAKHEASHLGESPLIEASCSTKKRRQKLKDLFVGIKEHHVLAKEMGRCPTTQELNHIVTTNKAGDDVNVPLDDPERWCSIMQ